MKYQCVTSLQAIEDYIDDAHIVAFDFETAPTEHFRNTDKAALNAHMSRIAGISFSVSEGTAIYPVCSSCRRECQ